jgi:hypothetical protein
MIGLWWGEQMRSLREHAHAHAHAHVHERESSRDSAF